MHEFFSPISSSKLSFNKHFPNNFTHEVAKSCIISKHYIQKNIFFHCVLLIKAVYKKIIYTSIIEK